MSHTRKYLDRKHFMNKLEHIQLDFNPDLRKNSLNTLKKQPPARKNKDKYIQTILQQKPRGRSNSAKTNQQRNSATTNKERPTLNLSKHAKPPKMNLSKQAKGLQLNLSKQSRESGDSLLRSRQKSYYIASRKSKRSSSVASKHLKSCKSKEIPSSSNIFNSTLQMQSFFTAHKKKLSNFSLTVNSRYDISRLNQSQGQPTNEVENLLAKSESILQRYKVRCQNLQQQNERFKKKYQEAMRKLKGKQI